MVVVRTTSEASVFVKATSNTLKKIIMRMEQVVKMSCPKWNVIKKAVKTLIITGQDKKVVPTSIKGAPTDPTTTPQPF